MFNIFELFKNKKNYPPIYLYNTLTRRKDLFTPVKAGKVSFYQCGPTVYWTQHIGNMRAMVMADLINRTFKYLGYDVKFVRNYTDVGHLTSDSDTGEDKMTKASKRENASPKEISEKYIKIFEDDVSALNTLVPDYRPKATEYVDEMIDMVEILLDNGFAYSTDLAIYFDVTKVKDYTKLSKQVLEDNQSGAGSGDVEDPQKKHPADFSIWFFKAGKHENTLQYWKSPFKSRFVSNGEGFPGWHIECSAMIRKLLGKTIDVHMGGIEHIPIHHTNEIAQSEGVNSVPLSNYWLHNEWLVMNSSKMAKSEGTSITLSDIKAKRFDPLALRFFFMQAHYHSRQNFTWEAFEAASTGYHNLINHIRNLKSDNGKINIDFKKRFENIIADDFNIPQGLALTFEVMKSHLSDGDKYATVSDFDKVLGLNLFIGRLGIGSDNNIVDDIEVIKLRDEREVARKEKNWQKSDELRDKIKDLGYEVKDSPTGPIINKL